MTDAVRIGGIKLSGELVQVDLLNKEMPGELLPGLLRSIASAKISIPHLHQGMVGGAVQTTLCIGAEHMQVLPGADSRLRQRPAVGTLSLFPHGTSLSLCLRVIGALAQSGIAIYGVSSSVSNLVIHTDYCQLDRAVEAVLTVCSLPDNHTPLRPVILLGGEEVETVAVYWEPKIRIYGKELVGDLGYMQLHCPAEALLSEHWRNLAGLQGKFRLMHVQADDRGCISCGFVVEQAVQEEIRAALRSFAAHVSDAHFAEMEGLEMVVLHGPHFHDRYGIASAIYSCLQENSVAVTASGCTGTSVHLLVSPGCGREVSRCLEKICVIPSGNAY